MAFIRVEKLALAKHTQIGRASLHRHPTKWNSAHLRLPHIREPKRALPEKLKHD